jgi:4'-phosphopantetheinyl transferase EntD
LPGEALQAIPARRLEFAAGRAAARQALVELGLPAAAIPMQPDRSPQWPLGVAGSITHSATACLAAVTNRCKLIGLDLEPATPLEAALWPDILLRQEQTLLKTRSQPERLAKLIFSAKEATYKAQYPVSRTLFGFDVIHITLQDHSFTATFTTDIPGFPKGTTLHGSYSLIENHFLTALTR